MSGEISAATRTELENILLLLVSDIRRYRDSEQKRLSDPTLSISELMRTMGTVTALKTVDGLIGMLAVLYKLDV